MGLAYLNTKKVLVNGKTHQLIDKCCSDLCYQKFSENQQKKIFDGYYKIGNFYLQTAYLCALISVSDKKKCYSKSIDESRRNKTRWYHLPDISGNHKQVCKIFFKNILKVSDGRITRALVNKNKGETPPKDRRGRQSSKNKTSDIKVNGVKDFINRFPKYESHYARHKSLNRLYLSPDLSVGIMYKLYKDEKLNDAVTLNMFRKIFNEDFNLHFHDSNSDSCRRCDSFKVNIMACINDTEKRELETAKELHQRKAESARQKMCEDAELAKNANHNLTVIAFDLMKTLPTPVLSTGVCYYKRQLWTYCFGIHNLATQEAVMYIWNESIASRGSQEIGSCLMYYINNFVDTENLIMYSDQCGGQNRNIKLSLMCNYMITSPEFKVSQIDHKFLCSGHSYLPCDQDFGLIEKSKKYFPNIYIPDDWKNVITSARKIKPFTVVEINTRDFFSSKSLENNITRRKISKTKDKVEWLKIQWLRFESSEPFSLKYKYTNQEEINFDELDLKKRTSQVKTGLELLHPTGNCISIEKKKDLLELMAYVPLVHHAFFQSLKTSTGVPNEVFIRTEEEDM